MKDENPFKEKLYQHTLPVSDDLWSRIESQLPADKKRFPFLFFALAVLIAVTALILFLTSQRTQQGKEKIYPERTLPTTSTPLSESGTDNILQNNNVVSTTPGEILATTEPEKKAVAFSTNADSQNKTQELEPAYYQSTRNQSGQHKTNKNHKDNKNHNYASDPAVTSGSKNDLTFPSLLNLSARSVSPDISNAKFSHLQALDFEGINQLDKKDESIITELLSLKPDPSCYKFTGEEGKSNLSVDLFVTPGFAPRSFENTGNETILYAEARKETESSQYAWAAGGRVNLNLNREFAVRLGVMYEQVGDIFDYTDTLATQRSTRIDSFFSADGTFLYAETNTVLIFGTLIKKIHNRYHHLDIPLLASYELCMGRAVIMVNAGPVINLTTSVRGQILNPGFVPQHISASETNRLNAYKTNVGLSLYLGAGAVIPFNKYFSGLVEPRFLYRIKPVTIDTYPLKEHRHFAGVNLGIRYHFD